MANEILIKEGTQIVCADATDYDNDPVADTDQLDLTSLANSAARQGDKIDFTATRARRYRVTLNVEIDVAPASGAVVELYFAPSEEAAAADSNPGGVSGSDSAYSGTTGDSLDDSIKQLDFIGSIVCTSDADPAEQQQSWVYSPSARYGTPVVYNKSGQAFVGDATEMWLIFTPLIDEVQ